MKKISFKNIFKKSEGAKGGRGNKGLLILLLILLLAGAIIYLGYPILFPERVVRTRITPSTTKAGITVYTPPVSSAPKTEEAVVTEKTPFDIEMEKRKQAYEENIFVYEPYEPPNYRNPFQRVSTSSSEPEIATEEEEAWWEQIAIYKPELPPETKLSGIVGSEKNRVAMIEMDGETFIAKLYDILLDKYIVKEIRRDEVILEVDDYEFSLKIGGEEASNE